VELEATPPEHRRRKSVIRGTSSVLQRCRDPTQAFQWYLASAQGGDPTSQINLATLYYRGEGISQDYGKTVRWLRASADAGCSHAQNNLAYFYFHGIVVQRNYAEAARLLQLAAQQNLVRAQTNPANLYSRGQGVSLDYVAVFVWYSRALAGGDKSAARSRENLARAMTKKQLDQAKAYLISSPPGMTIEAAKRSAPTAFIARSRLTLSPLVFPSNILGLCAKNRIETSRASRSGK
jgi:TPR repeat protein